MKFACANHKRFLRISSLLAFALLACFMHSCLQFRMSKAEIDEFFLNKHLHGKQFKYQLDNRPIHYVMVGEDEKPLVIFIHGSPGSLSAFIDFLGDTSLLNQARLISVDRPGFGESGFGASEPSIEKQSSFLKPILLKHKNNSQVFLVGHSLGGPLVARMAMDYPELIDGLILVAPSLSPELEPKEWFRKPMAVPPIRWILPRSIRASNDELINLKSELEKMIPYWKSINIPAIVIQGKKDRFVPYENAFFAEKNLVNSTVSIRLVDDMDHFVPWTNPELIKQAINDLIKQNSVVSKK